MAQIRGLRAAARAARAGLVAPAAVDALLREAESGLAAQLEALDRVGLHRVPGKSRGRLWKMRLAPAAAPPASAAPPSPQPSRPLLNDHVYVRGSRRAPLEGPLRERLRRFVRLNPQALLADGRTVEAAVRADSGRTLSSYGDALVSKARDPATGRGRWRPATALDLAILAAFANAVPHGQAEMPLAPCRPSASAASDNAPAAAGEADAAPAATEEAQAVPAAAAEAEADSAAAPKHVEATCGTDVDAAAMAAIEAVDLLRLVLDKCSPGPAVHEVRRRERARQAADAPARRRRGAWAARRRAGLSGCVG